MLDALKQMLPEYEQTYRVLMHAGDAQAANAWADLKLIRDTIARLEAELKGR